MTTLHFLRHARRAPDGPGDPPLAPEGRRQAEQAARELSNRPLAGVYASPLRRALQTAEVVAAPHGLATRESTLVRERANWGDLAGQTRAEFEAMWERCSRERDFTPPVGDSSREAGRRIERYVSLACEQHPGEHVLAVTHGGVLADFLLNVFSERELARVHPDFARAPYSGNVVRECSITTIQCDRGPPRLVCIAAASHLEPVSRTRGR